MQAQTSGHGSGVGIADFNCYRKFGWRQLYLQSSRVMPRPGGAGRGVQQHHGTVRVVLLQHPGQQMGISMQGVGRRVWMRRQGYGIAVDVYRRISNTVRIRHQRIDAALGPAHGVEKVFGIRVQDIGQAAGSRQHQPQRRNAPAGTRQQPRARRAGLQLHETAFIAHVSILVWYATHRSPYSATTFCRSP